MNLLSKITAVIVVIALIMVASFYVIGEEKSASVMDVSVGVFLDNQGYVHITSINGSLREMNKFSMPKGNDVIAPGVVANVIYKNRMIGYWTSVGIDPKAPLNSITTYNLTVGLLENPKTGDDVSVSIRLVGFRGEDLESVKATFKIP